MYHMILRKSLNIAACVCVCACVSSVSACVCVHVWEGVTCNSLIALYVKLNEAVSLVRIT